MDGGLDWNQASPEPLMVYLNGNSIREPDARGNDITDDDVIIAINADANTRRSPPRLRRRGAWRDVIDTGANLDPDKAYLPSEQFPVDGRSLRVLLRDDSLVDTLPGG